MQISESVHMLFFMAAGRNSQNIFLRFFLKKGDLIPGFDPTMCLNLEKLKGAFIIEGTI